LETEINIIFKLVCFFGSYLICDAVICVCVFCYIALRFIFIMILNLAIHDSENEPSDPSFVSQFSHHW